MIRKNETIPDLQRLSQAAIEAEALYTRLQDILVRLPDQSQQSTLNMLAGSKGTVDAEELEQAVDCAACAAVHLCSAIGISELSDNLSSWQEAQIAKQPDDTADDGAVASATESASRSRRPTAVEAAAKRRHRTWAIGIVTTVIDRLRDRLTKDDGGELSDYHKTVIESMEQRADDATARAKIVVESAKRSPVNDVRPRAFDRSARDILEQLGCRAAGPEL